MAKKFDSNECCLDDDLDDGILNETSDEEEQEEEEEKKRESKSIPTATAITTVNSNDNSSEMSDESEIETYQIKQKEEEKQTAKDMSVPFCDEESTKKENSLESAVMQSVDDYLNESGGLNLSSASGDNKLSISASSSEVKSLMSDESKKSPTTNDLDLISMLDDTVHHSDQSDISINQVSSPTSTSSSSSSSSSSSPVLSSTNQSAAANQPLINNSINNNTGSNNQFTYFSLKLVCHECGEHFMLKNDLSRHLQTKHHSTKKYECNFCSAQFSDLFSKKCHEREHNGLKPFKCYICSLDFTRASNLRTHLLKIHPNHVDRSVKITKSIDKKLKFEFKHTQNNRKFFCC